MHAICVLVVGGRVRLAFLLFLVLSVAGVLLAFPVSAQRLIDRPPRAAPTPHVQVPELDLESPEVREALRSSPWGWLIELGSGRLGEPGALLVGTETVDTFDLVEKGSDEVARGMTEGLGTATPPPSQKTSATPSNRAQKGQMGRVRRVLTGSSPWTPPTLGSGLPTAPASRSSPAHEPPPATLAECLRRWGRITDEWLLRLGAERFVEEFLGATETEPGTRRPSQQEIKDLLKLAE